LVNRKIRKKKHIKMAKQLNLEEKGDQAAIFFKKI